jgi:exodeoxyribonuclease V gamma subunit
LRLWLYQLVWAAQGAPVPAPARLIAEDEAWTVKVPEQARALLLDLLELRAAGLRRPLPFFPRAAWAFTGSGRTSPDERALTQWTGNYTQGGEAGDPAFEFCFGGVEPHPLNEEFRELARRICGPLRAAATKEKGRP